MSEELRAEYGTEEDEELAEKHFKQYFIDVAEGLVKLHKIKKGFEVLETYKLMEFWKSLPNSLKDQCGLNFESEQNLIFIIDEYLELEKLKLKNDQVEMELQE